SPAPARVRTHQPKVITRVLFAEAVMFHISVTVRLISNVATPQSSALPLDVWLLKCKDFLKNRVASRLS
ncbi:hypothetical protein ACKI14_49370, partial [Streptomyces turgidiscabies]|uniref:hypothetical protein n=1 Tax=Streptomyces turgidiscabies TaxID=85558 RepID=UPI0038F6D2AF